MEEPVDFIRWACRVAGNKCSRNFGTVTIILLPGYFLLAQGRSRAIAVDPPRRVGHEPGCNSSKSHRLLRGTKPPPEPYYKRKIRGGLPFCLRTWSSKCQV